MGFSVPKTSLATSVCILAVISSREGCLIPTINRVTSVFEAVATTNLRGSIARLVHRTMVVSEGEAPSIVEGLTVHRRITTAELCAKPAGDVGTGSVVTVTDDPAILDLGPIGIFALVIIPIEGVSRIHQPCPKITCTSELRANKTGTGSIAP